MRYCLKPPSPFYLSRESSFFLVLGSNLDPFPPRWDDIPNKKSFPFDVIPKPS